MEEVREEEDSLVGWMIFSEEEIIRNMTKPNTTKGMEEVQAEDKGTEEEMDEAVGMAKVKEEEEAGGKCPDMEIAPHFSFEDISLLTG